MKSISVVTYGTAGSCPVCTPERSIHGGNTTSLRILSECIPKESALAIDMGTGFRLLCKDLLKEGIDTINVLITHFHADHMLGLPFAPQTYMKGVRKELIGPSENGRGPKEEFENLMAPARFPVHFAEVESRFFFKGFEHPAAHVILFHPQGGRKIMAVDEFERLEAERKHFPIGKGKYSLEECLVVRMYRCNHPELTISYRFEERPTGKVFVFLTDHENMDGHPTGLIRHISGADLLIADGQYDRNTYDTLTAGFGHGTGDYLARLACRAGVKRVGITHHDPDATDESILKIVKEAKSASTEPDIEYFSCKDLMTIEI